VASEFIARGYIQTHCQKNKKIKRADQILPEVYGTTLNTINQPTIIVDVIENLNFNVFIQ